MNTKLVRPTLVESKEPTNIVLYTIGKCANCGVEFHIHKTKEPISYNEEKVKELCSKAIWDYIKNGDSMQSPLYGTDYCDGGFASKKSYKQCNIDAWFNKNKKNMKGQYVIIDLRTMDFMKGLDDKINYYPTEKEALEVCGMYEFENAWVMQLIYNYIDADNI